MPRTQDILLEKRGKTIRFAKRTIIWFVAGLAFATTVAAQEGDTGEIVVEGSAALDPRKVRNRVRNGYPTAILREPVMRFHDPICIQVDGLGPQGDAIVTRHMRETVRSLGLDLAGPGCRANAVVVVSTEPVAQLERIHTRSPRVLDAADLARLVAEVKAGAHAVVWHNRTVRGSNGEPKPISSGIAGYTGIGAIAGPINNNGRPSRVRAGYAVAANVGVIAYDANRLETVELEQLASNAVMRLLAPGFTIDVETGSPETVLSGIENGAGPVSLTRFDRAFLSALYDLPANARGSALSSRVAARYSREE